MIEIPPFVRLLEAGVATLSLVDWSADVDLDSVVSRHQRNRNASGEEKPSVSLEFVSDEARGDDQDHNAWETVRALTVNLIADAEIDSEDSELDPTGFLRLARINAAAYQALNNPTSPLRLLCDWVQQLGHVPDERSTPDEGRLVTALIVLYRVKSDDPNALLAQGVMA